MDFSAQGAPRNKGTSRYRCSTPSTASCQVVGSPGMLSGVKNGTPSGAGNRSGGNYHAPTATATVYSKSSEIAGDHQSTKANCGTIKYPLNVSCVVNSKFSIII